MKDDMISRQAALDVLIFDISPGRQNGKTLLQNYMERAFDRIKALPPIQPESCEGCRWEGAIGYGECHHCRRTYGDMYDKGETP